MRELVLDTETTGFDPQQGDRIVEIGAVELINQMPTGRTYHQYINPERAMPDDAFQVHGLGDDFLRDKPVFKQIAQEFLDFVKDDTMVIHNASFDMKFLNAELGWLNMKQLPMEQALDTLAIARKRFPGSPASLDALCRRFNIDNSNRTLHGALLDSEILAEVYLELLGGRQPGLVLANSGAARVVDQRKLGAHPNALPHFPLGSLREEAKAHTAFVDKLGEDALWSKLKLSSLACAAASA